MSGREILTLFDPDLMLLAIGVAPMAALCIVIWNRLQRERSQAKSLREQSWFARSTVDALSAQIAVLDSAGVILRVNQAWEVAGSGANGQLLREPVGQNYLAVCDRLAGEGHKGAAAIAEGIRAVATGQRGEACAEYCRNLDKENRWFLCRSTCFPGNNKIRIVVAHEDITDRKKAEEAEQEARRVADAASQAKSAFLANMSHEIRTPMTAMLGYADLLLDPSLPTTERQRCVQVIRRNGEHLLSLINDVLDISKIEANRYAVECVRSDLRSLLADVVALTRVKAIQKGLNFKVVVDGPVPKEIRTDPLRLKQILVNLIGNAVKFTTNGGVYVRVTCHDRLISSTLQVDVVDTGIGMSEQQIERLFRPFTQADESTTRKFGGSGLGLVISKRLAQLLGGDISVSSKVGEGTCFSVWVDSGQLGGVRLLPSLDEADLANAPTPTSFGSHHFKGHVLLAEDGEDNQQLISLLLRNVGVDVTLARNGREAVDTGSRQEFDLILMDMQMPELDGYNATKQLREAKIHTPIVALTANAMADDRSKCLSAGCDEYLAKPIRMDQFMAILGRFLRAAEAETTQQPAAPEPIEEPTEKLCSSLATSERFRSVLERFVSRLPERIDEMHRLLNEQNLEQLSRAVHQMKGAAGGYGFPQITAAAGRAEQSIKQADDLRSIARQIEALVGLVRRVDGFPQDAKSEPEEEPSSVVVLAEPAPKLRVDPQTGLGNKHHLAERISTLVALARRKRVPLTCIALHIPRLAADSGAILDGSELLVKQLATLLEAHVSGEVELFREDNATFVYVAPEVGPFGARQIIDKVVNDLGKLKTSGINAAQLSCTYGISELRLTTISAAELLEQALEMARQPAAAAA